MNPVVIIPPVVALALVGGWLASQRSSISTVEAETVVLRERIAAARSADAVGGDYSLAARIGQEKAAESGGAIDWEEIGMMVMDARQGGMPDMRARMKIQTMIMEMSGEELAAALDEIAASDMRDDVKQQLEEMLFGVFAQKEPQQALERYTDRINDTRGMLSWQLGNAFQQWAVKDLTAATAWFDRQIEAGTFDSRSLDGKNQGRLRFEAALISALLSDDPEAAGERLAALPENQRRELFQQGMFMRAKPGEEQAFAKLVREHVPEGEQAMAFKNISGSLVRRGGYEEVGRFMAEIDASPAERQAIAAQAAGNRMQQLAREGKIDRGSVDELRGWLAAESPDAIDATTGEALRDLGGQRIEFSELASIVRDLHREGAGDELLVGFLQGHQARSNQGSARELAEMIADDEQRSAILERLGGAGR